MKKSEQITTESRETIKYANKHITGISEGKEKREAILKSY